MTKYQGFQHGEAVIWGMRFALALSKVKNKIKAPAYEDARKFLFSIQIPELPNVNAEEFFGLMKKDKKATDGKVRFVLLKNIGQTVLDRNISEADLLAAFNEVNRA